MAMSASTGRREAMPRATCAAAALALVLLCSASPAHCQSGTPSAAAAGDVPARTLYSRESGFLYAVQGFAVHVHCAVRASCLADAKQLVWKKGRSVSAPRQSAKQNPFDPADNEPIKVIAVGLKVEPEFANRVSIDQYVRFNTTNDCSGRCYDGSEQTCPAGQRCLMNSCCDCDEEEMTLIIQNVESSDGGYYTCELLDKDLKSMQQFLEFEVEVLGADSSGLAHALQQNLTFDYRECCLQNDIKAGCEQMCAPGSMDATTFDPRQCLFPNMDKLLHCVTEGGNVSHVPCCRNSAVPPFCWEFCSGRFVGFKPTHKLCTFWMPEILQCYERNYLPFPDAPSDVRVDEIADDSLKVCWNTVDTEPAVEHYTMHYKELPRFPFLGGMDGLPLLGGGGNRPDEDEVSHEHIFDSDEDDDDGATSEEEDGHDLVPLVPAGSFSPSSNVRAQQSFVDSSQLPRIMVKRRRKRQAWVFVTHNHATNTTEVREFAFKKVSVPPAADSASEQCYVVEKLRPATQYYVYVTAKNSYGDSLPSVRVLVATQDVDVDPAKVDQIRECCRTNGVEEQCLDQICDLSKPPSAFGALQVAMQCRAEYSSVAPCLADGRNHTACCALKGVTGNCLRLCSGESKALDLDSVLCLTLDMSTIYSCLHQGYETHPSPPRRVTVDEITSTDAAIRWQPPEHNVEHVKNYTIWYRKDAAGEDGWEKVERAKPGHTLYGLDPSTMYMVTIVAHADDGSSLRSEVVEFVTHSHLGPPAAGPYCVQSGGVPLLLSSGQIRQCVAGDRSRRCPIGHVCDAEFCCTSPAAADASADLHQCCDEHEVAEHCKDLCVYNITAQLLLKRGPKCLAHISNWINCGIDGRDHRPCCVEAGIPEHCMAFCYGPYDSVKREHLNCIEHLDALLKCGLEGKLNLPGPPRSLHILTLTDTDMTIAWAAPKQNTQVDQYVVQVYKNNVLDSNETTTDKKYVIKGLEKQKQYDVSIVAINEHGQSMPSNNVSVIIEEDRFQDAPTPAHSLQVHYDAAYDLYNLSWQHDGKDTSDNVIPAADLKFNVSFYVHVADGPKQDEQMLQTDRTSLKMSLVKLRNYVFYVTACNDKTKVCGGKSETLSVPTVDERIRPMIVFDPDAEKGVYLEGSSLKVVCTMDSINGEAPYPSVNLTLPDGRKAVGTREASLSYDTLESTSGGTVECVGQMVGDMPVRVTKLMRVRFGVVVRATESKVSTLDQVDLTLSCTVAGFPLPDVNWYKDDTKKGKVRLIEGAKYEMRAVFGASSGGASRNNQFMHYLLVRDVTKADAGRYSCTACQTKEGSGTQCTSKDVDVDVHVVIAPPEPANVSECCRRSDIPKQCCGPGLVTEAEIAPVGKADVCRMDDAMFVKLRDCVRDGLDHRSCCARNQVPSSCLPVCDYRFSDDEHELRRLKMSKAKMVACSKQYSNAALTCVYEGRHKLLPPVSDVKVLTQSTFGTAQVRWSPDRSAQGKIQVYAVYYRPSDAPLWNVQRTRDNSIMLDGLESGTTYEIQVLGLGVGPTLTKYAKLDAPYTTPKQWSSRGARTGSSSGSGATALVIILMFALILGAGLLGLYMYRTGRAPGTAAKFGSFVSRLTARRGGGATQLHNDPSVAFENPSYDTAEARITGLPSGGGGGGGSELAGASESDWQSASLEAAGEGDATADGGEQRGMRYSKLQ